MKRVRVIPALLLDQGRLVKTVKFRDPVYVGDPINTIRIFNEKEVDELCLLDISATPGKKGPGFSQIRELAGECFMPLAYGGGITNLSEIEGLIKAGVEKVILNTAFHSSEDLVTRAAAIFGSQSVVVCLDFKRNFLGRPGVYSHSGTKRVRDDVVSAAKRAEAAGAGEIILNSISRDGTGLGYDVDTIRRLTEALSIPLIAMGGAGSLEHMQACIAQGHASAVAAGSLFVFKGRHKAVLVSYPSQTELKTKIYDKIDEV